MPYIKKSVREDLLCSEKDPKNAGELNYSISKLCGNFVQDHSLNYQTLNDVVGALEGAKQEFIRRIVNPYEKRKIKENGDIASYKILKNMYNLYK